MSDATRIATLEAGAADAASYLGELAATLASHGSNLAALRMAELEQKVSPYLAGPGAPIAPTVTVGGDVSRAGTSGAGARLLAGAVAYVTNTTSNTVSVISLETQSVVATFPVAEEPRGIAVSPPTAIGAAYIYIARYGTHKVDVFSATTFLRVGEVDVGTTPLNGVAVTPDGAHVYVANYGGTTVSVIQTSDNTVSATVTVGTGPHELAVSPDGAHVYVVMTTADSVKVIQTSDNTVYKTITFGIGDVPFCLAIGS